MLLKIQHIKFSSGATFYCSRELPPKINTAPPSFIFVQLHSNITIRVISPVANGTVQRDPPVVHAFVNVLKGSVERYSMICISHQLVFEILCFLYLKLFSSLCLRQWKKANLWDQIKNYTLAICVMLNATFNQSYECTFDLKFSNSLL